MPKKQKALWQELKLCTADPWTLYLSEYQDPFLGACYATKALYWSNAPFNLSPIELDPLDRLHNACWSAIYNIRGISRLEAAFPMKRSYDHPYVMFIPRRSRKVKYAGIEFNEPAFMGSGKALSYVPKGIELESRDTLFKIRDAFRKNLEGISDIEVATE